MKSFFIIFILFIPYSLFSQGEKNTYGIVRGNITTADKQVVPYATLMLKKTGQSSVSDENGNFEIKKVIPGTYLLRVSLSGYVDSIINIDVKQNEISFVNLELKETYAVLETIIIEARSNSTYVPTKTSEYIRLNLPLLEVPQNIEVTSNKLLSDQGSLSMSEAMRTVSGITKFAGGLNDYNPLIRGTDATWAIFRNGVPGYWWNQQEDVAMLEKIEFIKGPAGFLISVAQPGGIINNITKQPGKERIANFEAGFGSYNMARITADLGGPLGQKKQFTYRVNVGVHSQKRAFQFANAYRYFICTALKFEPSKRMSVTAEFNYMHGKTAGNNTDLPSIGGKMFVLPDNFSIANAATDAIKTMDAYWRVELKYNISETWHWNTQLAYVHGEWGGYMLNTDNDSPVENDTLNRIARYDDYRNFSAAGLSYIDGSFFTGQKIEHRVLTALDYCRPGFSDALGETADRQFGLNLKQPRYSIDPSSLRNFQIQPKVSAHWGWTSIYFQDNIKINGKLIINVAGHFTHAPLHFVDPSIPDYQTNVHSNVFSPRAGLTWLLSENASVYLLYDKCFWVDQGRNIQNKPFIPSEGSDIETGLKIYFFNKKLITNVSIYDIVKNHTITPDPSNFGYYIQKGQITSKGIDFDLTGNITQTLTINANYSYTDAKITKDSDPNMVGMKNFGTPDHYGNLWIKYNLIRGKTGNISFAAGYQFVGKRNAEVNWIPGTPVKFLPAYCLFDAALSYKNDKIKISLNIYNLSNIQYAALGSYNSSTNEWRYTPGEPNNFRLSFGINLLQKKNK